MRDEFECRWDRIAARGEEVSSICEELKSVLGLNVDLARETLARVKAEVDEQMVERNYAQAE